MSDSAINALSWCISIIIVIFIFFVIKCSDGSNDSQNYQDLVLPAYNEWNSTEYERINENLYYIMIQSKKPSSYCFIYGNHFDGSYNTLFVNINNGNRIYDEYGNLLGYLMVKDDNTVTVLSDHAVLNGTYTRKKGTPIRIR